jgi:hypothetical protein
MVGVVRSMAGAVLPVRARRLLRSLLRRLGHAPARGPLDFRALSLADPLLASRRSRGRRFLVDVPLERFRILDLMGFSCAPGAPNPFVATVRGILDGSVTGYEDSELRRYYERFTPRRICDLYGFPPAACSALLREPAIHAISPWQKPPGAHMAAIRRRVSAYDHAPFGDLPPGDDSWLDWGPVSPAKAAIEYRRLADLASSISRHGYLPGEDEDEGHMTAHLLEDGGRSVAWIMKGNHRAAVLAALGHPAAPVVVIRVFRRDEVRDWPGVASGAFTPGQALQAFDLVFAGRRPPAPGCEWWPGNGGAVLPAPQAAERARPNIAACSARSRSTRRPSGSATSA